jgi:superfamily II DNA or RNA helicase
MLRTGRVSRRGNCMSNLEWPYELPPGSRELEYQFMAANRCFDSFDKGKKNVLLSLPTGTGKTYIAGLVIQKAIQERDWRTLFLAHRRKLIFQAKRTFEHFGFITYADMASLKEREMANVAGEPEVTVATPQTLSGDRLNGKSPHRFELIILDECHRSFRVDYGAILDYFQGYKLIGMTATADGSKKNLGSIFESVAYRYTLRRAIEEGSLVPIKLRTIPVPIDLRQLRMTATDFSESEIAERIGAHLEILAYNIAENIGDRPTIVFCPDLGSSSALASMIRQLGAGCKYVAGSAGRFGMKEKEQAEVLKEFENGGFQVLVSCDLLMEGYDCPRVSCVAICRPTLKRYRYMQMAGRGTRLCEGKSDMLLLDFDWRTDESSKKLCVPVVLFADDSDEEAMAAVEAQFYGNGKKKEGEYDLLAEIKRAEVDKRFVKELVIPYTGKYARKYQAVESDPVGVCMAMDFGFRKRRDLGQFSRSGFATPAQAKLLTLFGIRDASKLSKWGASRIIDKLQRRESHGLASHQQVLALLKHGVSEDQARIMTKREAGLELARQHVLGNGEQKRIF